MAIKRLTSQQDPTRLGSPTYELVNPAELERLTSVKHSKPEYFETTWVGCVLSLGEHNHHDDSDFYAIVWDAELGGPREIEYATTRGWTYANSASVDATEEVKAAYKAYQVEQRRAQRERAFEQEANTPRAGRTVKTVKVIKTPKNKGGLNIPVGTELVITWFGEDKYRSSRWASFYRVGFDYQGQRVFTSADNVEVVRSADRDMLDKIAAKIWPGQAAGVHADDITMKLMELANEWRSAFPEQCASMDKAVEYIEAGPYETALKELDHALGS